MCKQGESSSTELLSLKEELRGKWSAIAWCNQGDDEISRTTLRLTSIIYWSGQPLQHVLSLRYSSGLGHISCFHTLTQTLDITECREGMRLNVIQTNTESFYFSLMSVAASARSPQKYVNIFFSRCQTFSLSPPIFDMTVGVRCEVYTVKINESMLCLTGFTFLGQILLEDSLDTMTL